MRNTKLILMLESLTEEEIRELGKFLEYQGHRKTGGVMVLYKYLQKYAPNFPEKNIKKETIKKKLFKGVENADRRINDTTHKFVLSLEKFMVSKTLETSEVEWDFLLLKSMKERKLDKLFFQKINATEKKWNKTTIPGIEHLHDQYKLKHLCLTHQNYSLLHDTPLNPPDLLNLVDHYYFATKLYWNVCIQMNNKVIVNKEMENEPILLNEIIGLSKKSEYDSIPQLAFFTKLLKGFKTGEFENYNELQESFFKNIDAYSSGEQVDLMNILSHICYKNYKKGIEGSLQQLFDFYRFCVEKGLIIHDQYIASRYFDTIVNIGCAAKELEWTERFIKDYQKYLKEEDKNDITSLCEANLAICKNDFELALQKISMIQLQDPFYGLQARSLQLKCFYELEGYEELFYNLIRSFSTYLNRDKLFHEQIKEVYQNYIKYTKEIQKLKENKKQVPERLVEEINKNNVAWKQWLLKKTKELQQKEK